MPKVLQLEGQKFGKLTAIRKHHERSPGGHIQWVCACECGNEVPVYASKLKSGHTQSCGCARKETLSKIMSTHKLTNHPLHVRWFGIKARCYNPNHKNYLDYGARGITVCDEWLDFQNFYDWSMNNGYDKSLELDRIDNNKGYSPSNCQWITHDENMKNTRHKVIIEGKNLMSWIKDLSEKHNLTKSCLLNRYYRMKDRGIEISTENILNFSNAR